MSPLRVGFSLTSKTFLEFLRSLTFTEWIELNSQLTTPSIQRYSGSVIG